MNNTPHNRLRHYVTGAIERGEAQAIVEIPALQSGGNLAKNTAHTPGPWSVSPYNNVTSRNGSVAKIEQMPGNYDSEREANAHLISAAPDLLSALQWFADELPGIIRQYCPEGVPTKVGDAHEAARNAIAKAKGEA